MSKTSSKSLSNANLIEMLEKKEEEIEALKKQNILLQQKSFDYSLDNSYEEIFSLRNIIALMPGNVFWKDKNGKYLGCNNNLAKFLGFQSPNEVIGKTNKDFIHPAYAVALDKIDQETMETKIGKHIEEVSLDLNYQPAVFFTQKNPLFNTDGEVIGLLGISIDITERKKIEQELYLAKEKAEASDQAKSQFLAVVNHELRTPLTGILGLIDFLKQKNLPSQEKNQLMNDLENCGQYLLNLVNNVLDFARLEAGKNNLVLEPINLVNLVHEVCSMLNALAKNKNIDLRVKANQIPTVLTDASILNQILINLINNAIKFTDQGYVAIDVSILDQTKHKIKLEIAVQDTGHGIPQDQFEAIFEPFRQLENTYVRQSSQSGTGLGLSIVKRLAAWLNIDIRLESTLKIGTTFYLTGEFNIVEEKAPLPTLLSSQASNKKKKSPLSILLVEDDFIVQHIHEKFLRELGYQVDIANNGATALKILNQQDLILVDIGLPDITGFELISRIRARDDIDKHVPIIAITGYTGEKERNACLAAGANEIVTKPISLVKLQETLLHYTH